MDKETMHEFDASFLTAVEPLFAKEIAAIRKRGGHQPGRVRTLSKRETKAG
jgi:DNA-binding transcriptional regulator YiaG